MVGDWSAITGTPGDRLSRADRVAALCIVGYWLVYENLIFFYSREFGGIALFALTNLVKVALPFALLAYTGLPRMRLLQRGVVAMNLMFFTVFLAWGLVPTLLTGNPVSWAKLLPRFVLYLSAIALYARRPAAFTLFSKCVVVYVLSALAQYVLLYLTGSYGHVISTANGLMAGPFGILGNVTSMMFIPGIPLPLARLSGFWNEPSNAAGSAFAACFLARYLVAIGEDPRWRLASRACIVAGLMALSNAGYLAFGSALLFGLVAGGGKLTARRTVQLIVGASVAVSLLLVVVVGRAYVATNLPDSAIARAVTGARNTDDPNYDPTNGRLALLKSTASNIQSSMIGVGIQEVGSEGIESSASAPFYWLLLTGVPGLLLILGREAVLRVSAASLVRRVPAALPLTQALIAVMAQQAVYGSWMNPNYLILAAMVVLSSSRAARLALAGNRPSSPLARASSPLSA
jgi:hypothetical protein